MSFFPPWMPIAKQKPLVRAAWVAFTIAALGSFGLFTHLYLKGEVNKSTLVMAGIGIGLWIAFGTVPALGKRLFGR